MFQPSLTDKAFDDFLTYLKDTKKCEPVSFVEFVDYFMPKYKDTYLLMKNLKDKGHINYNENYSSVPVSITEVGIDFVTRTNYVNESKKLYEKEQNLLNQTVSVGTNYGQINAGHQSSFDTDLINPTIHNTKNPIKQSKIKTSLVEKLSWIFGIIVSILAIYEFIIKNLIHNK